MPHLVVEYSANLEKQVNISEFIRTVHDAAAATGVFELGAIRTRAERRDLYVIADGDKKNAFVAVQVRIGAGRDEDTRRRLGKLIFEAVCGYLEKFWDARSIAVSLEIQEIDSHIAFRKNGLHSLASERTAKLPS